MVLLRRIGFGCLLLFSAIAAFGAETEKKARARLEFLEQEVARHDQLYFREARSEISDFEYDQLKRELNELRKRFPDHELPPTAAGDDRAEGFAKRPHRARMLSLEKVYSEAELRQWLEAIFKRLPDENRALIVEPKFDGIAISAVYENGRLAHVATRGNGSEGDDITENVRRFCTIPETLSGAGGEPPRFVELRGEAYVSFAEFRRINEIQAEEDKPAFTSPRNVVAGTLKTLHVSESRRRKLDLVFYGLGAIEPAKAGPESEQRLIEQLRRWQLPVPQRVQVVGSIDDAVATVSLLGRDRSSWPYPTDGVVVKLDAFAARRELGEAEEAPRWAVAFKFTSPQAVTRVKAITIQIGRTGVLTPVAELEPVRLGGATIARATLHNAEEIGRRDVRVGDYVVLERAGEIIPAIVGVDLTRRPPLATPFVFPRECPGCGTAVEQRPSEVARRCENIACPAQLKRRVRHFASPEAAGIKGLGPAVIDALVDAGKIQDMADLYQLRAEDLLRANRLGEKTAETLVAAIHSSKHQELWRVIHGLSFSGVGKTSAKKLATRFGSLRALAAATEAELQEVEGFGASAASRLAAHLERPEVQRELGRLADVLEHTKP